jgi:putative transposase
VLNRSYKIRLYPTTDQAIKLSQTLDLCRELYNAALQERRDAWRMNRVRISFFDQSRQVPEIRKSRPDLMCVQARVLDQTLRDLHKAFAAFFRRIKAGEKPGYPRFKSANRFATFHYNREGFTLGPRLQLANIGKVKYKGLPTITGRIKQVSIKREGKKWFAVLCCADVPATPLPPTNQAVGVDMGIESFASLSDGTQIDNWRYYESSAKQLRVAQRRVSRRKKGSHRRRKAVAHLRAIHQKIFNRRADFQHKLSTDLIKAYDLIAVEKLNIKGLARARLAKQVHDASWSSFLHMLTYKAESAGRQLIEVDARGTSQTCTCGTEVRKDLSVRWHHCPSCGLSEHRDIVSAKVILQRGLGRSLQALTLPVTACVA